MVNEESQLAISMVREGDVSIISLVGSLDAFTAESLESQIGDLHNTGQNRILIDFGGLVYISSAGLGVFMSHIEEIRETGGDIKMFGMNDKIFKIFDLLGFPMIFDISRDKDKAIQNFKGAA
jgi:anti-sigma B factor antagonist